MSTNITNFSKLSELISLSSKRKPKILINPAGEYCIKPIKGFRKRERFNYQYIM